MPSATWTRVTPDPAPGMRVYTALNLDPENPGGCQVWVPEDAIANRMEVYGARNEQEALEHIMYEHFVRMNPSLTALVPYAVKQNFERVWGPDLDGLKPV